LSVSIADSALGSPLTHVGHSPDDSLPASPSHHYGSSRGGGFDGSEPSSPRAASSITMQSSIIDPTASPKPQAASSTTSMHTGVDGSPTPTSRGLVGQGSVRPVVIVKVDPVILSARSNYFRIMFSGRWRETQKSSVHLPNLSEAQFRAVLSYCYRGYFSIHDCSADDAISTSPLVHDLDIPLRFAFRLIDIARFFGMPDLVHYCQTIMQPLITPINAGKVWLASTNAMHLAPSLAKYILEYFRSNFLQCCLETTSADDSKALSVLAAVSAAAVTETKSTSSSSSSVSMIPMAPHGSEAQRRRQYAEWLASERVRQSSLQSAAAIVSRLQLRPSFLALQPQHLLDALGPGTISVDTHVMLSIVEQWADAYARSGRPLMDRHSLPVMSAQLHGTGPLLAPSPTPSEEMTFLAAHRRRASSAARSDDGDADEDMMLLAAYSANTETPTGSASTTPAGGSGGSFSLSSTSSTSFGPALPPAMEDRRIVARRLALKAALLPPGTLFNASHRSWLLGKRPSNLPAGIFF